MDEVLNSRDVMKPQCMCVCVYIYIYIQKHHLLGGTRGGGRKRVEMEWWLIAFEFETEKGNGHKFCR